jgi:thymidylate kinase
MTDKPMLICITGIDGVGKTTHVDLILEYLRSKGIKCEYRWLRFHHFVSLPLLAYCRLAGYTRTSTLGAAQKCSYHEFYRSKSVSLLYPWLLLIDTALFTAVKVYLPMRLGTSIVCDRFVYDTLVDLAVATGDDRIDEKTVGRLFLKLIPGNSRFVMLTADKHAIYERRAELRDDLLFDRRSSLFGRFSRVFDIRTVDNTSLPANAQRMIKQELKI